MFSKKMNCEATLTGPLLTKQTEHCSCVSRQKAAGLTPLLLIPSLLMSWLHFIDTKIVMLSAKLSF